MRKHYIIGDIHGEYQILLNLISKLPSDAKLIFVGDLINRGKYSQEVVEFVKKYAFRVVRGNHEEYLLKYGALFLESMDKKDDNLKYLCGVISSTLQSYGLLSLDLRVIYNKKAIERLKSDMEWMASLPFYLELGIPKGYSLPVVVSHGSIEKFWVLKDKFPSYFEYQALNSRHRPSSNAKIFNIYGHKRRDRVLVEKSFVSLDTGCGKDKNGLLSAYCLETKEVISVGRGSFYMKVA
jgi:serine/threonine protein phosphatase 1